MQTHITDWVLQSQPRTRTETYPLYLLTKDLLQRLTEEKCEVIDSRYAALQEEFRQLQKLKELCDSELAQARRDIQQLDSQLLQEKNRPVGVLHDPADLRKMDEMEVTTARLQKELHQANDASAKLHAIEEEARKHAQKYHKEADAAKHALQDALAKLKKAEDLLHDREGDQDPLDTWSSSKKCANLGRLLTDDDIVHSKEWEDQVIKGLTAPQQKGGCAPGVKRHIASKLLTDVYEREQSSDSSSSVLSLCTRMIARDPPLDIYEVMQECITKEVKLAPAAQQAAFVEFLGSHWFCDFESTRDSVDRIAKAFSQEWGAHESPDHKITRQQLVKGLDALGITEVGAGRFLRAAVGDRWLSLKVQAQALRALAAPGTQVVEKTDHSTYLADDLNLNHEEDHIRVSQDDIRRAIQAGGPYHTLVEKDVRYEALSRIFKSSIDHELGGHGVGAFLESHHAREDDHRAGYAGIIEVVADMLHVNRSEFLMEVARTMPSEVMSLAKQGSHQAAVDRHSMLRYATSMISGERRMLLAWREEVDICREERRLEEEERKAAEEAQRRAQTKMQKPHDMGLYEGGKPTNVKTLGTAIAHIYENKGAALPVHRHQNA